MRKREFNGRHTVYLRAKLRQQAAADIFIEFAFAAVPATKFPAVSQRQLLIRAASFTFAGAPLHGKAQEGRPSRQHRHEKQAVTSSARTYRAEHFRAEHYFSYDSPARPKPRDCLKMLLMGLGRSRAP